MKYRNILVLFLAAIVFFVGAGVTVVDLCCSGCIDKVMSMQLHAEACSMTEMKSESPSCCSQEDHSEDVSLCVSSHAEKCCEAKRVSMDLDRSVYQPNLLQSMVWTMVSAFISGYLPASDNNESLVVGEARDPVPIPPRNYLSMIRVLII
ncbi:hypothetical protein [Dysgonomonas alginatilytica]|nr:hypothetical protein [Dysgonomonas alginatilytica]